ncbi:hypothetical protein YC2023_012904 [Brassica napus]
MEICVMCFFLAAQYSKSCLSVRHVNCERIPFCISSRSIKKLSVYYNFELETVITDMPGMSFDAPNLNLEEYPQVDLESLVEARLNIQYSKLIKRPDMSGLINGISNVHTLILTPASADVISRCVKHGLSLPVFKNLVGLSFRGDNKRCWKLLPYLIKHSPNLCTLIIHGLDDFTCDGTMHLVKVKVLHVLGGGGSTARELEHLMSILGGVMVDDCKLMTLVGAASSKCKTDFVSYFYPSPLVNLLVEFLKLNKLVFALVFGIIIHYCKISKFERTHTVYIYPRSMYMNIMILTQATNKQKDISTPTILCKHYLKKSYKDLVIRGKEKHKLHVKFGLMSRQIRYGFSLCF